MLFHLLAIYLRSKEMQIKYEYPLNRRTGIMMQKENKNI